MNLMVSEMAVGVKKENRTGEGVSGLGINIFNASQEIPKCSEC